MSQRETPPLPPALLAMGPIVYIGTAIWFVVAVVLTFADRGSIYMWTAWSGGGLGIIGALIMLWQRQAGKRGSKAAQRID
ncbi:DUF2530 domain-containing protein [Actinokineospora diospyrosa]|uniref:DUF2530 domain-containing protein n=1 Tax=Actinokineospora diospyrosa TaxID=103728 RepID=A0ABT1IGQ9_9PSEU|nr:DUF2530 domain-containing protein [Actinokineospora diospyrosa]MCP2271820.1 Protein of unknown function (DUF2530) [Actinokineospora diospyrosa]